MVKNRLNEIRHKLMINSIQEMADILGLTRAMLSNYEHQKAQPNIETLLRISKILSLPIEEIVYLDDPGD